MGHVHGWCLWPVITGVSCVCLKKNFSLLPLAYIFLALSESWLAPDVVLVNRLFVRPTYFSDAPQPMYILCVASNCLVGGVAQW